MPRQVVHRDDEICQCQVIFKKHAVNNCLTADYVFTTLDTPVINWMMCLACTYDCKDLPTMIYAFIAAFATNCLTDEVGGGGGVGHYFKLRLAMTVDNYVATDAVFVCCCRMCF